VDQTGDAIVHHDYPDENKNNQNHKVLTGWQNDVSLYPFSGNGTQLPGAAALHIQCNHTQANRNKDQKYDKKPFHSFFTELALFLHSESASNFFSHKHCER
jgi:hypothetical protein